MPGDRAITHPCTPSLSKRAEPNFPLPSTFEATIFASQPREIRGMTALNRENVVAETERVRLKRKLTAVLLADVVGYSRLMNIDEENTHVRLADCIKTLIEPTVASYEGRVIRSKGDGLLIEFDSAVAAVNCAVDIQHGLAVRQDAAIDNRKLRLRIGINSGDVIVHENDIYGNSVNIAARLEALAEPGGISVTAAVRDQLLGHPGLFFEDTGVRRVKNIDRPIRVYRVTSARATKSENDLPTARISRIFKIFSRHLGQRRFLLGRGLRFGLGTAVITSIIVEFPMWQHSPVLSARASIMVLPFRNLNGRGEQYFADAVTDILTTDLSRLSDTIVITRSTAFTYRDKVADPREIRREFGVRYILEGSIEKIGTRVQANAEASTRTLVPRCGRTGLKASSPTLSHYRRPSLAVLRRHSIFSWSEPNIAAPPVSKRQTPTLMI